jgi:hypothetical protein
VEFRTKEHPSGREFVIEAKTGEYDACPLISEVSIGAVPKTMHPDRVAVALCLMFNHAVSGTFSVPVPGCSPNVARAIEDFLAPVQVSVFPVNCAPSKTITGMEELVISCPGMGIEPDAGDSDFVLEIYGSDALVGMSASATRCSLQTNALLLAIQSRSALQRILPVLGVAMLFCEDLLIGKIRIPVPFGRFESGLEEELAERLHRLLDSTGMKLYWQS